MASLFAFLVPIIKSILEPIVGKVFDQMTGPQVVGVEDADAHLETFDDVSDDYLISQYGGLLAEED